VSRNYKRRAPQVATPTPPGAVGVVREIVPKGTEIPYVYRGATCPPGLRPNTLVVRCSTCLDNVPVATMTDVSPLISCGPEGHELRWFVVDYRARK
jgi:hypothetical protein